MNGKMILLVEDETKIQDYNKHLLIEQGFAIETAMTLTEARSFLKTQKAEGDRRPDAVILDIGMPDGNGLDFLREIRRQGNKTPVLLLTGFGKDNEIETGFDAGCDDYLPKPYTFGVLHKRLLRLLKSAEEVPEVIEKGALTLKIPSMTALLHGTDLLLTKKEFALLLLFVQNEGGNMNAEDLYKAIWGTAMNADATAVRNTIYRLKTKIDGGGYTINNVYGGGYCFERE
jgi:two-component system response regulator TctD